MRLHTASFLCLLAILATIAWAENPPGDEFGLHPTCGAIRREDVNAAKTVLTHVNATELDVSCISYNVLPNGNCTAGSHRLVLEFFDPVTNQAQSVDVDTLYTGSLYATAFRFNTARLITMYLDYAAYASCPAAVYYTANAEVTTSRATAVEHPYVTSASPLVMYRGEPYTIRMRSPASLTPSQQGEVRAVLISVTDNCQRDAPAVFTRLETTAPSSTRVTFADAQNLTWTATASSFGGFALCVRTTSSGDWAVAAFVQAFNGSAAYFDAHPMGRNPRQVTLRFDITGNALSASDDRLGIVEADDSHSCLGNPPLSDEVALGSMQQLSANKTRVTIGFSRRTLYYVCYRSAASGQWAALPNWDTMERHVITNFTALGNQRHRRLFENETASSVTPPPGTTCATAPRDAYQDQVTTDLMVVLTTSTGFIPDDFREQVAAHLCIEDDFVQQHIVEGPTAYMRIVCSPAVCNSAERMVALARHHAGIANVVSGRLTEFFGIVVGIGRSPGGRLATTQAPAAGRGGGGHHGDDDDNDAIAIGVGVAVGCVVLAAVTAVIVIVVVRGKKPPAEGQVVQGQVVNGAHSNAPDYEGDTANLYANEAVGYPERVEADDESSPIPPPPVKP